MLPSVTFLFGCWFGCLLGLFLAGALSASRDGVEEFEAAPFPARAAAGSLAIVKETEA